MAEANILVGTTYEIPTAAWLRLLVYAQDTAPDKTALEAKFSGPHTAPEGCFVASLGCTERLNSRIYAQS